MAKKITTTKYVDQVVSVEFTIDDRNTEDIASLFEESARWLHEHWAEVEWLESVHLSDEKPFDYGYGYRTTLTLYYSERIR